MTPGTIKLASRGYGYLEGRGYRLAIYGWLWSSTDTRVALWPSAARRRAEPAGPTDYRHTPGPARDYTGMALCLPGA
jgi:hypothetical protein